MGNTSDIAAVPVTKKLWVGCLSTGLVLWLLAIVIWVEGRLDQSVLFYFDRVRASGSMIISLFQWLSSYGLAGISTIYVLYLLASYKWKSLDAPPAVNFFVICSFAISGIAGDLLKLVISRPRPSVTFADTLMFLHDHGSSAMPSGHSTKAMALAIPFVLLAAHKSIGNKVVKILVSLLALGVVISRVIIGAHFVSDVVAGMGMAFIGFPFTMLFANMVLKQVNGEILPRIRIVWGVLLIALTVIFMMI